MPVTEMMTKKDLTASLKAEWTEVQRQAKEISDKYNGMSPTNSDPDYPQWQKLKGQARHLRDRLDRLNPYKDWWRW